MQTEMYQRKIIAVEAVQVTEENLYEIAKWCGGDVRTNYETKQKFIKLSVLHPLKPEHSQASPTNWILKSDAGYKIFNDKAFLSSWEKVCSCGNSTDMSIEHHQDEPCVEKGAVTPGDRLREQLGKANFEDTLKFQHEMAQVPAGEDS